MSQSGRLPYIYRRLREIGPLCASEVARRFEVSERPAFWTF